MPEHVESLGATVVMGLAFISLELGQNISETLVGGILDIIVPDAMEAVSLRLQLRTVSRSNDRHHWVRAIMPPPTDLQSQRK
ncbi:MAG: hypothetical protein C7B45_03885 [Sulfobacillus acidophilus]|uniref:Uncharacterized protein n=1 Tax=Sulfobacillus acidophilus TaxID=53633 RepID=A0A2T2WLZ0_9FIRM|nr:MAG: hypothetical protein C7B45_03885 [Sulfobacillus acidophilus]